MEEKDSANTRLPFHVFTHLSYVKFILAQMSILLPEVEISLREYAPISSVQVVGEG